MWSTLFTIIFAISVVLSLSVVIIDSITGEDSTARYPTNKKSGVT
jgi:hypothetical protein